MDLGAFGQAAGESVAAKVVKGDGKGLTVSGCPRVGVGLVADIAHFSIAEREVINGGPHV